MNGIDVESVFHALLIHARLEPDSAGARVQGAMRHCHLTPLVSVLQSFKLISASWALPFLPSLLSLFSIRMLGVQFLKLRY